MNRNAILGFGGIMAFFAMKPFLEKGYHFIQQKMHSNAIHKELYEIVWNYLQNPEKYWYSIESVSNSYTSYYGWNLDTKNKDFMDAIHMLRIRNKDVYMQISNYPYYRYIKFDNKSIENGLVIIFYD